MNVTLVACTIVFALMGILKGLELVDGATVLSYALLTAIAIGIGLMGGKLFKIRSKVSTIAFS